MNKNSHINIKHYINYNIYMNTIIVDKNIKDIYNIVVSEKYIKSIYKNAIIKYKNNDTIKIINKYNNDLISYYDDDILNIIKNIILVDFIVLSIKQNIKSTKKGFILEQILHVKNKYDNNIILSTMLNNHKIYINFEYSSYNNTMTIISLLDVRIIENNNFNNKIKIRDYDNTKLIPLDIDEYLQYYEKCKKNFFNTDIKYSDNLVINIINIIADNSIKIEYMRNIIEYYNNNNNIPIYSFSHLNELH